MGAYKLTTRGVIGTFFLTLAQALGATWVPKISMLMTSNQAEEVYAWLGMVPALREWIGGRQPKGFREFDYAIKNKKWESTIEVKVTEELKRDKSGQVLLRVREQARRAAAHWAKLLSVLIDTGGGTVCYDKHYFFDTDHVEGDSGAQSNLISVDISELPVGEHHHGSATAPSPEELMHCILQGCQTMLGFKDDQGEPMNELARSFIAMVPVSFMKAAIAACGAPVLSEGTTNQIVVASAMPDVNFNITPVVNPRLTWTDSLSIFRTDAETKALICQEEDPISMSAVAEGSELEFNEDLHRYGVKAVRNAGYGFWQHSCKITLV